jgi:hypothetical protein
MFNPEVEIISTEQKYNIQFAIPFIICICIMLSEKVYLMFNDFPELFVGADIIYHSVANILSVITQLAASIAAAIIFYYCSEFLSKKKDMEKYIVMRRSLLITMYFFMDMFERFDNFEVIKCSNNNKRMHDVYDVEPFYNLLKKAENDDAFYHTLEKQVEQYIQSNMNDFEGNMRAFRSNVNELNNMVVSYRYFRNSFDNMNDIKNIFEELDTTFIVYKDEIGTGEIDEEKALNEMAESFIDFVCNYVDYEVKLGTFITAINRKQAFTFMRLLD